MAKVRLKTKLLLSTAKPHTYLTYLDYNSSFRMLVASPLVVALLIAFLSTSLCFGAPDCISANGYSVFLGSGDFNSTYVTANVTFQYSKTFEFTSFKINFNASRCQSLYTGVLEPSEGEHLVLGKAVSCSELNCGCSYCTCVTGAFYWLCNEKCDCTMSAVKSKPFLLFNLKLQK